MKVKMKIDDEQADKIVCESIKEALKLGILTDEEIQAFKRVHNYFSLPQDMIKD